MVIRIMLKTFAALLVATACSSPVFAVDTNYFLVAVPMVNDGVLQKDSYLLPLSKQEDIDHARYLISLGWTVFSEEGHRTIVGARVGLGKDGINRNYFDPMLREWSWH